MYNRVSDLLNANSKFALGNYVLQDHYRKKITDDNFPTDEVNKIIPDRSSLNLEGTTEKDSIKLGAITLTTINGIGDISGIYLLYKEYLEHKLGLSGGRRRRTKRSTKRSNKRKHRKSRSSRR